MAKDEQAAARLDPAQVDAELKKELEATQREETPEGLLSLARQVQRMVQPKAE